MRCGFSTTYPHCPASRFKWGHPMSRSKYLGSCSTMHGTYLPDHYAPAIGLHYEQLFGLVQLHCSMWRCRCSNIYPHCLDTCSVRWASLPGSVDLDPNAKLPSATLPTDSITVSHDTECCQLYHVQLVVLEPLLGWMSQNRHAIASRVHCRLPINCNGRFEWRLTMPRSFDLVAYSIVLCSELPNAHSLPDEQLDMDCLLLLLW